MRHIYTLPTTSIMGNIVPAMNKLLMLLIDRSTSGTPHETPNFNRGRKNAHEA